MHDLPALASAAFHNERVAARRLAKTAGITETEALRATLERAAAQAGWADVAALLEARARLRLDELARRADKARARAEAKARRLRARSDAVPGAWRAWFDGSATPNPGLLGIGALLCAPGGERVEISRRAGHGDSSEAEYLALEALLEAAVAARVPALAVYGDSRVVIDDVNAAITATRTAPRGVKGPAKGLEAHRARVLALMARLDDVTLRWVPRHRNGEADSLSQRAIRAGADRQGES
ncbi:reverse transcriptase-like protein [Pseudoduganella namucuonensis]|uniref:Ribonuclease HI n=1 Tax=Pseudoduganella namucuonensis TaxID=1035707 RepID=A0A1I7GS54_9BURK|nr:reverse transcriptase-like protein [Pseudoduganella namucuonensis]SFU51293.1 ribonuclease HI [Pseudoduganella namucuonensis]